jgi:tetratricopeptide (TPR) repeat protein
MGWRSAVVIAVGAGVAALAQPRVDGTRIARSVDNALVFAPNGQQLEVASMGFQEPVADLLWVRAVLVFGERWGRQEDATWTTWLRRMLTAVTELDSHWHTPYQYGGLILKVAQDVDGADDIFRHGMEAFPNDPFFPFSIGMDAYLARGDAATAADYLERAAASPEAPPWYAAAAAAMRQRKGERRAAIEYLRGVRRSTTDPHVIADTDRQLARLYHNEIVSRWEQACLDYRARTGHPLASPAQLAELGFKLPENPRGDAWIVGTDGVVRSKGAEGERIRRMTMDEMRLVAP